MGTVTAQRQTLHANELKFHPFIIPCLSAVSGDMVQEFQRIAYVATALQGNVKQGITLLGRLMRLTGQPLVSSVGYALDIYSDLF